MNFLTNFCAYVGASFLFVLFVAGIYASVSKVVKKLAETNLLWESIRMIRTDIQNIASSNSRRVVDFDRATVDLYAKINKLSDTVRIHNATFESAYQHIKEITEATKNNKGVKSKCK